MKPLGHNYRRFPQNPFLKERLVRANPEDHEQPHEEHKSETPHETESDFVRQLKEMMETNVDYENRKKIEANWGVLTSEYERWERYQSWVAEQKALMEQESPVIKDADGKDVPFDMAQSAWRERVGKMGRMFDEGRAQLAQSGFFTAGTGAGSSFEEAYKTQLNREIKPQIVKDCERIAAAAEARKKEIEKTLIRQMKLDFDKRLQGLASRWEQHPPEFLTKPGMEDILANRKAMVADARKKVRELSDEDMLSQYKAELVEYDIKMKARKNGEKVPKPKFYDGMFQAWRGVRSLELMYEQEQHTDEKSKQITLESLQARLQTLKDKKSAAIIRVEERFNQEKGEALAQLESTLATVQDTSIDLFGGGEHGSHVKHDLVHDLEERIKSIKEGKSLEEILESALSSTEIVKDEFGHDNPRKLTKGLEGQIAMLNDPTLPIEDKIIWMEGLDSALKQYEKLLSDDEALMFALPQLKKQAKELSDQINARDQQDCVKFFTNKYSLYFLSPYNSTRAISIIQDWGKRIYDRKADKNLSQFGSDTLRFAEKIPLVRTLPNEFGKIGDTAEQGEVHQFEEAYKNRDAWQVYEIAESTRNEDEFRACLQLLAHHGRLRWDRIGILRQFNYFQNKVEFDVSSLEAVEEQARDLASFEHNLERACDFWDADAWAALDRQNKSAYDHELKETEKRASSNSAQLVSTLDHLLLMTREKRDREKDPYSDAARVESHQYDEYVKFGIESGTFNTHQGLYYTIQGLAEGIIPMDRVSPYRNDFMNSYPVMEFINSKHPELKDGGDKPLSIQFFRNVASLSKEEFQLFFYDHVMRNQSVRERLDKTVTSGKRLDHDMIAGFFPYMSTASMKTMLRKSAEGGTVMPETGILNASAAEDFFLDHFASINDQERKLEDLTTFASSFVLFNGIVTGRLYKNGEYGTLNSTSRDGLPRSQNEFEKISGAKGRTMNQNLERIKERLMLLDQDFFGFIFSPSTRDQDVPALLAALTARYGANPFGNQPISSINELAEHTSDFLEFIGRTSAGRTRINEMISKIQNDQHARHAPDAAIPRMTWQYKLMPGMPVPPEPAEGHGHGGH